MHYTHFGASGLVVSRLALGMALRQQTDAAVADHLIGHALDNGINLIDCADRYSPGDADQYGGSEVILGRALKGRRDQVVITSKVGSQVGPGPNDRGSSRGHILREVERSLDRLRTDYIDVYLLHAYDQATPLDETMRALDDLVRSGKVRYIGACNFQAWQICKGLWTADRLLATPFMCVQNAYNLLSRQLETEMFPLARDQGLGIMVYGPLAVGLLGGDYSLARRPPVDSLWGHRPEKYERMIQGQAGRIVVEVNSIARELGRTPAQVSTAWILSHPEITCVICGSDTIEQLDDSVESIGWSLDDEHLRRLDEVSSTPAAWN